MDSIDSQRWKKIQDLFDVAVDMPTVERLGFLREKCTGDQALFDEVTSLIKADKKEHDLLDRKAADFVEISSKPLAEGSRVGPYRIVRQIGIGGMGAVYLAERADGQFVQKVALKLIKRGMDSDDILARFRSERQILASLNHPNISRLVDGGVTDAGLPYFTMEYVEGEPIDVYCDKRCLSVEDRLKLFLTVCEVVRYAQQNLVVHRDIKPSNIMVTEDGDVKLLDFGIAKLVGDRPDYPASSDLTRTGLRVMTPGYASPEQVRGLPVTTASDVYSLGVVLYKLLTGLSPYLLTGRTAAELEQVICNTDPQKPSTVITGSSYKSDRSDKETLSPLVISRLRKTQPKRLRRQLAGDLDNICLMALRKESVRRYQSAGQMADDIRRHLNGHPVVARRDSVGYRTGKFLRRHRTAVVSVGLVFMMVLALVGFYTYKLAGERDKARQEARRAKEISEFLTGMFEIADPNESRGENITAREILDRGAVKIETELIDLPVNRADMMFVVGGVYHQLGLLDKADTLMNKALLLRQQYLAADDPDLADNIHNLAVLKYDEGEYELAEAYYRRSIELYKKNYGNNSVETASGYNDLGVLLKAQGKRDEAEMLIGRALTMRLNLLGEENADVAHSLNHLGSLLISKGEYDSAESCIRRGLDIRQRLYGDNHVEVVASMGKLASFLSGQQRYVEAEVYYRKAYEIISRLMGENHHYVGGIVGGLALLKYRQGDIKAADSLYRKCLEIYRRTLPGGHVKMAKPLIYYSRILLEQGRPGEAEPLLREALELRDKALPAGHRLIAEARGTLGRCLSALNKFDEAEKYLSQSFNILYAEQGVSDTLTKIMGHNLIEHFERTRDRARADSVRLLLN